MSRGVEVRPLTNEERRLARWVLEHGSPVARDYLGQLESAEATTWRCPCGCASFNIKVAGKPVAPPGVRILGNFVFGDETNLAGIFIYSSGGIFSGVEVTGLAGDHPASLPEPVSLRPLETEIENARRQPRHPAEKPS